jgi:hypothetical protein
MAQFFETTGCRCWLLSLAAAFITEKRLCNSSLESKLYKNTFPQVGNESKCILIEYLAGLNEDFDESIRKILKKWIKEDKQNAFVWISTQ